MKKFALFFISILVFISHNCDASSASLKCSFGFDENEKYFCNVTGFELTSKFEFNDDEFENNFDSFKIESSLLKIIRISGDHREGKFNSDVLILKSKNINFEVMPANFHQFFPKLEDLTIQNGNLKQIHEVQLKNLQNLINLDLSSNKIELIERNLLKSNVKLQTIDFSGNKIRFINQNSFDHLKNLKTLNLQSNQCHSSIITGLTSIQSVYKICFTDIDHLTAEFQKSKIEHQIQIENLKNPNDEILKKLHQVNSKNRIFVADTNIFMTVLGISIIAIVFYLVWPFYKKIRAASTNDELYENFMDDKNIPTISENVEKKFTVANTCEV